FDVFAGKKLAQIREILISESTWEEMTCLFAPSLEVSLIIHNSSSAFSISDEINMKITIYDNYYNNGFNWNTYITTYYI
uniref:hypothetical protein n=1 Tax=Escherichia coli TaxID=562 RepID=UPI0007A5C48E